MSKIIAASVVAASVVAANDGAANDGTASVVAANDGAASVVAANDGAANDGAANDGAASVVAANDGAANDGAANDGTASSVLITVRRDDIFDTSPITIDKTKFNQPFPCNHNMFRYQTPLSKSAKRKQQQELLDAYFKHMQMVQMYRTLKNPYKTTTT